MTRADGGDRTTIVITGNGNDRGYYVGRFDDSGNPTVVGPGPTKRTGRSSSRRQPRELTINAVGSTIPVVYGRNRVGGAIFFFDIIGGSMYIGAAACWGEIDSFEAITLNDLPIAGFTGVTYETFTGTTSQSVSSILQGARVLAGDTTYDHVHPGLAYVAIKIQPNADITGVPDIKITVKGRKVYDPRTATTAYSSNPFLCLRDLLVNDIFGGGIPDSKMDDGVGGTIRASADYADDDFALPTPSSAPTAAIGAAGALTGIFDYVYTYVDGVGNETMASPISNTVTVASDKIDLTGITVGPAGTVSRKIYRRQDPGTVYTFLHKITDNTTTTYTDNGNVGSGVPPVASYTKPRWEIGIVLNSTSNLGDWIDTMRAHAPCWITNNGQVYCIIADQPDVAGSVHSFSVDDIIVDSMSVKKAGFSDSPTTVTVKFTDQKNNFNDASVRRELASVAAGTDYRREASYDLPGIPDADIATRLAIYYINKRLADIMVSFETPGSVGIKILPGDLIDVTYPVGFTATPFRVIGVEQSDDGHRWTINALEYSTAPYSDVIQEFDPGTTGGPPDPFEAPPPPTGLTLTTIIVSGRTPVDTIAKIQVDWTPGDTPYYKTTRIEYSLDGGSTWIQAGTSKLGPMYVENVTLGVLYTFRLYTVSATDLESTPVSDTITPEFIDVTIPDVVQAYIAPNCQLEFYGPLTNSILYFVDSNPTVAPSLGLTGGGITPTGVHGYAYSWVRASGESGLSPVASINVTSGNQIVDISGVLDGPADVLYKKVYFTKSGGSDLYHLVDIANGSTTLSHNSLLETTIPDSQLAPSYYDALDSWEVLDQYLDPTSPPTIARVRVAPQRFNRLPIPQAVHPNATTGQPEINVLVRIVSKTGARSAGVTVTATGLGWPSVPMESYLNNSVDLTVADGQNDDVSINVASTQRLTGPTADFSITGLVITGDPAVRDLQTTLFNNTPYAITLKHEDAGSTAANRFNLPWGLDYEIAGQYGSATVEYDFIAQRWRVIAANLGGTGPGGGVGAGSIHNQHTNIQHAGFRIDETGVMGIVGQLDGSIALVDGNNDDILVAGGYARGIIQLTDGGLTGSPTIRSMYNHGNLEGSMVTLWNNTGWPVTLQHNWSGAVSGGKFQCPNGVDVTISVGPYTTALLMHPDALGSWIVITSN